MKILILGAAGMLGRKLLSRLATEGLEGAPVAGAVLHDVVDPAPAQALPFPVECHAGDYAVPGAAEALVAGRPDVIFHLASIVSGEAEARFEEGYRVNLDGTRALLEAIRVLPGYRPRVVFASSLAVFGAPCPEMVDDDYLCAPSSSYGVQKAMVELLLADYSRRGFIDGLALRLPTVSVRPGRPNAALSGFLSSIMREPLNGLEAVLPVEEAMRVWIASPRAAVSYLAHAATLDTAPLGARRSLNMPGVSVTVGEQIAALRARAGERVAGLIRRAPDATVTRVVGSWPQRFAPARAQQLGFVGDTDFAAILDAYIDEELGGRLPPP
ncbi:nucleoside-diphosphate-sugar epimerase [Ancylobacter aquaticus]|uniref:Nucleoside-diphosphate-sugar epimerase n=1 Tax=Ancylobacter aquaticus TaxID=100 RepID=A0A4R1I840_ANCAQ|nr:D-erythronate dehydrogenase [Ancylobacter aquaticus]TCK30263.1 nucleoside-diphosphate-sugar epimerase [Ancylobacter aquaticus]